MSSGNIVNPVAFLRTTRNFPEDLKQLSVEINKTYVDIANCVNDKTTGIFTVNKPAQNAENWFVTKNQKQQGLRQIYQFSDTNLTILHGINLQSLTNFVRIWGTFFDGTNWQTLPYVDVLSVTNQINVKVNSTQIVITKGTGAPPTISKGIVILEWISNP